MATPSPILRTPPPSSAYTAAPALRPASSKIRPMETNTPVAKSRTPCPRPAEPSTRAWSRPSKVLLSIEDLAGGAGLMAPRCACHLRPNGGGDAP